MRQTGIITAPARVAVEDVFLGKKLKKAQKDARSIADAWVDLGGKLAWPTETNMVWLDLDAARPEPPEFAKMTYGAGLKTMKGRLENRLIVHYQISEDAVERLLRVFVTVLGKAHPDRSPEAYISYYPALYISYKLLRKERKKKLPLVCGLSFI